MGAADYGRALDRIPSRHNRSKSPVTFGQAGGTVDRRRPGLVSDRHAEQAGDGPAQDGALSLPQSRLSGRD